MSLPLTSVATAVVLMLMGKILEYLILLLSLSLSEVLPRCSGCFVVDIL